MADVRLTIQQAAKRLGVSEGAIRRRVKRGTLRHEREGDNRIYVYLPEEAGPADRGQTEGVDREPTALISEELVSEMRGRIEDLQGQLEAERQAHAEARRLLLEALTKIPAAIGPSEPRESPESPDPTETPTEGSGGPQSPPERPWWRRVRRMFGG